MRLSQLVLETPSGSMAKSVRRICDFVMPTSPSYRLLHCVIRVEGEIGTQNSRVSKLEDLQVFQFIQLEKMWV